MKILMLKWTALLDRLADPFILIALVAADNNEQDLVDWCKLNHVDQQLSTNWYMHHGKAETRVRRLWLRTPEQQMAFKLAWYSGEPEWPT